MYMVQQLGLHGGGISTNMKQFVWLLEFCWNCIFAFRNYYFLIVLYPDSCFTVLSLFDMCMLNNQHSIIEWKWICTWFFLLFVYIELNSRWRSNNQGERAKNPFTASPPPLVVHVWSQNIDLQRPAYIVIPLFSKVWGERGFAFGWHWWNCSHRCL